jgi:GntR family transcriptional regulator
MERCEAAYRYLGIYAAQGSGVVLRMAEIPGYEYMRVADDVERRIASGEYAPGSMLPGERAMAEEQGVAIGTVRRAVAELRERGIVVTLPHKGTFVTGPPER